jgi:hypothetical protein
MRLVYLIWLMFSSCTNFWTFVVAAALLEPNFRPRTALSCMPYQYWIWSVVQRKQWTHLAIPPLCGVKKNGFLYTHGTGDVMSLLLYSVWGLEERQHPPLFMNSLLLWLQTPAPLLQCHSSLQLFLSSVYCLCHAQFASQPIWFLADPVVISPFWSVSRNWIFCLSASMVFLQFSAILLQIHKCQLFLPCSWYSVHGNRIYS